MEQFFKMEMNWLLLEAVSEIMGARLTDGALFGSLKHFTRYYLNSTLVWVAMVVFWVGLGAWKRVMLTFEK